MLSSLVYIDPAFLNALLIMAMFPRFVKKLLSAKIFPGVLSRTL